VVAPALARRAAEAIPAVDVSVAYGVPDESNAARSNAAHEPTQVLVVSVSVVPGSELTGSELDRAYDGVPVAHRPDYVQVVASIPVTTWCRPLWRPLLEAGVPTPSKNTAVWRLDPDRQHYRPV
jgi:putative long chain acyl-CoA synthase